MSQHNKFGKDQSQLPSCLMPAVTILTFCKKKKTTSPSLLWDLLPTPRLWALTINLFTLPPGGHSSWGGSLLCSLCAWQGNKATFSLFFKTLSLYFYLALVHREPRFWQQNLFFSPETCTALKVTKLYYELKHLYLIHI